MLHSVLDKNMKVRGSGSGNTTEKSKLRVFQWSGRVPGWVVSKTEKKN